MSRRKGERPLSIMSDICKASHLSSQQCVLSDEVKGDHTVEKRLRLSDTINAGVRLQVSGISADKTEEGV